jgi:hypothetical protein
LMPVLSTKNISRLFEILRMHEDTWDVEQCMIIRLNISLHN